MTETLTEPGPKDAGPADGAQSSDQPSIDAFTIKDPERFARNLASMIEEAGKAAAAWSEPRERGEAAPSSGEPLGDMVRTFSKVTEYWLAEPQRAFQAQTKLFTGFMTIWANSLQKLQDAGTPDAVAADPNDKRFQDPDWSRHAFFDFLKQTYLIVSRWADELVQEAADLDPATQQKARFYVKQVASAISPSNFVLSNPELLRETMASNGENLVRGMRMLAEDIAAGNGEL